MKLLFEGDKVVDYETKNGVAYIFLNRPHRLNAITIDLIEQLTHALERAESEQVKAVVLSGRGKSFSSGHDLQSDVDPIPEHVQRHQLKRLQNVTRLIWSMPCPVIAKVHGYALGAGCEIALGCDVILAASNATFGFPEVSVGLSVTGGISSILANQIGLIKAKEMLFFSKKFSGEEAEKLGLINRSVPFDDLDQEVERWVTMISEQPYNAINKAKEVLNHGFQHDLESSFRLEIEHALQTAQSEEFRDAVRKFEKKNGG